MLAVLALLAGVLLPTMKGELDRSHRSNALADVYRIAVAVNNYMSDMTRPPTLLDGRALYYLHTAGHEPLDNPFAGGPGAPVDEFLITPTNHDNDWAGPYLGQSPTDPWGRQYVINLHGFHDDSQRAWILSSGANGIIETTPSDLAPINDDIGMYIR